MKWLGDSSHSIGVETDMLNQSGVGNVHDNMVAPQLLRQAQDYPLSMGPNQDTSSQSLRTSSEDTGAMVGYMFQRDPDYVQIPQGATTQHFINLKQQQQRWALGDDSVVSSSDLPSDQQPQQQQQSQSQQQQQAQIHQSQSAPTAAQPMMFTAPIHPQLPPHLQALQFQHFRSNGQTAVSQIPPSAKKLWGVDEPKDDSHKSSGGILNLNDHQMWRDSTWSTSDHAVTQPMTMVPSRRPGVTFPGTETGNILSPRSSDSSGLGVKMVEYVLGTSPTSKDGLEPRMRGLVLSSDGSDVKKDKDKAPASPYDVKKDLDGNNIQSNGMVAVVQNGIDNEDKYKYSTNSTVVCYNRTPGSRQPSPTDEADQLHKNAAQAAGIHTAGGNVVIVENHHPGPNQGPSLSAASHHLLNNHHAIPLQAMPGPPLPHSHSHPAAHHHMSHLEVSQHFDMLNMEPGAFESQYTTQGAPAQQSQPQQNATNHTQPGMDSPNVIQSSFDVQQLFRSQQQPQQVAAPNATSAAHFQVIQQQQYYTHLQQQQQLAAAGLPTAGNPFAAPTPYIINPQEPGYVIAAGPTVVPAQYYGVPWGVYPTNLIQQSATPQQRRPLSPSSATTADTTNNVQVGVHNANYQVIPAYYDQNGSIVMPRGATQGGMRLVSPAPVLVNATNPGNGTMRLVTTNQSQPQQPQQQLATPPSSMYTTQPASALYSTATPNAAGTVSGLGLGTGSTGRRDSFDRNTSAFSPSLEYGRPKWPQSYGALGTVTASPSPLGLNSGSLTPPPSLGSSTNLQLGGLMGAVNSTSAVNRSLLSAAPGAEAMSKYRANGALNANGGSGLFGTPASPSGTTGSLFAKLVRPSPTSGLGGMPLDKAATNRSRVLEDFRVNSSFNDDFNSYTLRDLTNHIMEFAQDQHGSRFIQQKLERATVPEKQFVFQEILPNAYNLMTDVFGNYVIQKFFEFGTPEQKAVLAQKVRGHVLPLALQMYGCRVIQKALESISPEQQLEIVRELDGHVLKCVKDQNGNHVVQKCIECVEPHALQFIISSFKSQVPSLSTHPYGCRVIQRILEHCTPEQVAPILEELHENIDQLIQDQYGNYVIQHVLEHGKPEDKSVLINAVRGKVLTLSQHKFASNVVEKCVTHATRAERALLIEEVCGFNDSALNVMMKDQYANYVVQKMLDVCEPAQRKILMHKIKPHFTSLKKFTYGKHIIAKLEKYFMKAPPVHVPDLGPIGPPTNGIM